MKKIAGFILGVILALNVLICNSLYCCAAENITVLENFYSNVLFVKDDSDFQNLFKQFKSVVKANVQKWNSNVSDEMYEAWSDQEATEYYFLYICPKIEIETNSQIVSKSRLTDSMYLNGFKDVILNYENGETYYKELVKVWEWIWDEYEQTTKVPDLFAGVDLQNFEIIKSIDESSNEQLMEISEIKSSVPTESVVEESIIEENDVVVSESQPEQQNSWLQLLDVLKNNIFTLIVLVGVGIAIIIIRRRNKDKITNDKI